MNVHMQISETLLDLTDVQLYVQEGIPPYYDYHFSFCLNYKGKNAKCQLQSDYNLITNSYNSRIQISV